MCLSRFTYIILPFIHQKNCSDFLKKNQRVISKENPRVIPDERCVRSKYALMNSYDIILGDIILMIFFFF